MPSWDGRMRVSETPRRPAGTCSRKRAHSVLLDGRGQDGSSSLARPRLVSQQNTEERKFECCTRRTSRPENIERANSCYADERRRLAANFLPFRLYNFCVKSTPSIARVCRPSARISLRSSALFAIRLFRRIDCRQLNITAE